MAAASSDDNDDDINERINSLDCFTITAAAAAAGVHVEPILKPASRQQQQQHYHKPQAQRMDKNNAGSDRLSLSSNCICKAIESTRRYLCLSLRK
jgi:hypothetical protein